MKKVVNLLPVVNQSARLCFDDPTTEFVEEAQRVDPNSDERIVEGSGDNATEKSIEVCKNFYVKNLKSKIILSINSIWREGANSLEQLKKGNLRSIYTVNIRSGMLLCISVATTRPGQCNKFNTRTSQEVYLFCRNTSRM